LAAVIVGVAVPAPIAAAAKPPSTTVYVSLSGEPHTPLGWWDLSSCERPDAVGGVAAIEAVIDEAESPTTIYLCDGEYDASSTIDVGSKEGITLDGSRDAILNGNGDRIIHSDGSLVVRGLTLVNGSADQGGAIWGRTLTLYDVTFVGNTASDRGGAVYATTKVTTRECEFEGNASDYGGAVYAPLIESSNSAYYGNVAEQPGSSRGSGGAIYASSVYVGHANYFGDNRTDGYGGAIRGGSVRSSRDSFVGNSAYGGGAVSTGSASIQQDSFVTNTAAWTGGALVAEQGAVGSSRFTANSAEVGGGLFLDSPVSSTLLSIRKNRFEGNQSEYGGGLAVWGDTVDVKSMQRLFYANAFKKNSATEAGGAIWCYDNERGSCFR
jgi:predicted outer membrane repeat protein